MDTYAHVRAPGSARLKAERTHTVPNPRRLKTKAVNTYRAGMDIGSTTVKLVLLDDDGCQIYGIYRRHRSHVRETLAKLLDEAEKTVGNVEIKPRITGSGSINLAKHLGIEFCQEVIADASAIKFLTPRADVAIELGGEDAKIIYLTGSIEQRMNGVCAGGTGSFIDQMASLLQTDASGLNEYAKNYRRIYPIAARCGVFAKSDIQPLINEGATKEDLSASIFQAVVNQTIGGLACGKPIRGNVAFLGGPLHFLTELRVAFIRTLRLSSEQAIEPENSHMFAAIGAALGAGENKPISLRAMSNQLKNNVTPDYELKRLEPLFADKTEYEEFNARHNTHRVTRGDLKTYRGDCYLGIDAGSTTTKLALIGSKGELLWSFYSGNDGSPVRTAMRAMADLAGVMPGEARIRRACSTGYGETLLKSAFNLDDGEVETVAHYTAAAFFDSQVDCLLDIGGQDMKFIKIKNNSVDSVLLNEACSSGCGSFIENFAASMGCGVEEFASRALFARHPLDLGTRCTVFMNSNVKQAQKEGAELDDISAGLAYSVIKNALFKVIKLSDASTLGHHIIVQGGTFLNPAVLRAFEKITGVQSIRPDIAGLMGAFGAALLARERADNAKASSMISFEDIANLTYKSSTARCGGCQNNCLLTINRFSGSRINITGNRCEKGAGGNKKNMNVPNLMEYKLRRMFYYEPLRPDDAPRGVVGLPRVLNMYEDYPFWAVFFRRLGFSVLLSPLSDRHIYELGMESIPSDSECYPAKLAHGHVEWLFSRNVDTIFYPSIYYERRETPGASNNQNCPMVIGCPENIKNNVETLEKSKTRFIHPFLSFAEEKTLEKRLIGIFREEFNIPAKEVAEACRLAWDEKEKAKSDVRAEGAKAIQWMEKNGKRGIVLAGRPYHIDPEINHGIPELITSYGLAVLTEDSLTPDFTPSRPLRVNDQWTFHSRLYNAAEFVCRRDDMELIQLNSFGCGLDAVTTDQVADIMEASGKLYTVLKIDEVQNLGAVRIRLRSLIAAMDIRTKRGIRATPKNVAYQRRVFTKQMRKENWTLIAPQMAPIHFDLLEPVFRKFGYNMVILDNDSRAAVDMGLKSVNNDACYPSLIITGQIMDAVLSGQYDTSRLAILMSQTGGCCRASNYIGFIRRALDKAGMGHIPVISLNLNGMEKNPGFRLSPVMLMRGAIAIICGDLFMKCLHRTRPYELQPGSAEELYRSLRDKCVEKMTERYFTFADYRRLCREIVDKFDHLPIREGIHKPRVGIVGEILVKFMPLANNHLVELLEREGAETVVPDLLDFFEYCGVGPIYKNKFLGGKALFKAGGQALISLLERLRAPAERALKKSRRFLPHTHIREMAKSTSRFIDIGNQYGEGWFLTAEMSRLLEEGVNNIVCVQPFGCLPNHVVGKGVIKTIKRAYPKANIAAVDYDPSASEVNQLNRIKLMLSTAEGKI